MGPVMDAATLFVLRTIAATGAANASLAVLHRIERAGLIAVGWSDDGAPLWMDLTDLGRGALLASALDLV